MATIGELVRSGGAAIAHCGCGRAKDLPLEALLGRFGDVPIGGRQTSPVHSALTCSGCGSRDVYVSSHAVKMRSLIVGALLGEDRRQPAPAKPLPECSEPGQYP